MISERNGALNILWINKDAKNKTGGHHEMATGKKWKVRYQLSVLKGDASRPSLLQRLASSGLSLHA